MTGVNGAEPDHILALLGSVMDDVRRDLHEELRRRSAPGHTSPVGGLRSSQLRLLSLTPPEGMRVTDLAERVGMTKQALGEFANTLQEQGMLESVRDPGDRRVRILRPTPLGLRCVRAGEAAIDAVEQRWRERVGARTWDDLRATLVAVRQGARESQDDQGD